MAKQVQHRIKMETEDFINALNQRGLTLRTVPSKGRAVFTTKIFRPGEVIIKQEPYVCVPSNSVDSAKACDECFFPAAHPKKCSACQIASYCGATCQKLNWKLHRIECQQLRKLEKEKRSLITPSLRLMLKLYIRRRLQAEKIILSSTLDNYGLVENLVSHMKEIEEKQLISYAQVANLVSIILQWPELNLKEVAENFSKFACNAHTICDGELRPLGTGLYPVISLINHSCSPNAVLVFQGKSAVVRALQLVPEDSEVCISYIETAACRAARRKSLQEQYFFICSCPRCIKSGETDDPLEGYRCRDSECSGHLLLLPGGSSFQCRKCSLGRDKEEIKLLEMEANSMSEQALNLVSTHNRQAAISMYKAVEEREASFRHPLSLELLQTREKLLKALMEEQAWRDALVTCRSTLPVYEEIYPEIHPLLGLQYFTCGKLEWLLEETENSIKSLGKALDALRMAYGNNAGIVEEITMRLNEARAEASLKLPD